MMCRHFGGCLGCFGLMVHRSSVTLIFFLAFEVLFAYNRIGFDEWVNGNDGDAWGDCGLVINTLLQEKEESFSIGW